MARTTEATVLARLQADEYRSLGMATSGISRSKLSAKVKKKLIAVAEQHFEEPVEAPKATAKKDKKNTSFLVTFARHATVPDKKREQLDLLRGAADAGMTLPELVKAYEDV